MKMDDILDGLEECTAYYEMLEGIADSCQDVANTIETIIMRKTAFA
jgi:uncharacterized protein Yka (UPF0111/DUF47 family)